MARRPDLFQLCPGKKTFSPVSLDSLDIHRGQWKSGGLQHSVGVGGARRRRGRGDESGTRCFILFRYRKDMAFAVFDEQNQTQAGHEGFSCLRWPSVIQFIIWQVRLEEGAHRILNHFYTF